MAYFVQYDSLIEGKGHKRGEAFNSTNQALLNELLSVGCIAEHKPDALPTQEDKEDKEDKKNQEGEAIDLPAIE
ncbi:hypothetical protein [Helicobacter bizzozeronii]|uniref:hypothetical protein n=1 Tax=Helicobacter bizzozeronii TaxID=56877 RepID=UPI000CEEF1DA|nr:hypothetical protein [Helicobacter bizzozeronii]